MRVAYCNTHLNYVRGNDYEPVETTIYDARASQQALDFDECGFILINHRSKVTDWNDTIQLNTFHCSEMADVAREFTGCRNAVAYPPIVRSPEAARTEPDYAPIHSVHADFTEDYRTMIEAQDRPYRDFIVPLLEKAGITQQHVLEASRVMMLQLWRNLGHPWPDTPLAVCDASTVPRKQLGTFLLEQYAGQTIALETFYAQVPEQKDQNHWYTFPGLEVDEVIAFRAFDSDYMAQQKPFWTLHSAFNDPLADPTASARESIEMRVLCLW
ncbi:MAG: CmcJ/NvfI family oxidoreductase [Pseudomonadales bacterium]|nr:CmcJ/NvfI family oxidoreductase [Pseudomonadales bacterium]